MFFSLISRGNNLTEWNWLGDEKSHLKLIVSSPTWSEFKIRCSRDSEHALGSMDRCPADDDGGRTPVIGCGHGVEAGRCGGSRQAGALGGCQCATGVSKIWGISELTFSTCVLEHMKSVK